MSIVFDKRGRRHRRSVPTASPSPVTKEIDCDGELGGRSEGVGVLSLIPLFMVGAAALTRMKDAGR